MPSGVGARTGPSSRRMGVPLGLNAVTGKQVDPPFAGLPNGNPSSSTSIASLASGDSVKNDSETLLSVFECPVCFDFAVPPLFQCQSGHMVCEGCRAKLSFCPTCRGPIGNVRNLLMEKVAATVNFPCKYSNHGCAFTMRYQDKPVHDESCEFRPYSCPCPGASCRWSGLLEQVIPHLLGSHKSITTLQGEDIVFLATDITLPGAVDWVMMQSCFNHYFMLILEKQERTDGSAFFYAVVLFVGNRRDANAFAYRLELHNSKRRLTWEATPRSIHEGVHQSVFGKDCLMFDSNIGNLFAENGNLGINVTVTNV